VKYKDVDVAVTTNGVTRTLVNGYTYYDEYLALDMSESLVSINVAPSIPEASNNTEISAATNNPSGFTLYMVGGTINTGVIMPDDRLAYQGTPVTYINSIPSTGALSDNTWGFQFTSSQPTIGDTNWRMVPNSLGGSYGTLMQATGSAPIIGQIDNYNVWFGAKINANTKPGDYVGHVVWTLTANL
jgi:hypothetical protein